MLGTYLQLDEVLLAVDDGELALLVELADVARLEPALPARGVLQEAVPRQVGHVVVPLGDGIAAQPHLACGDGILSFVQYFQHINTVTDQLEDFVVTSGSGLVGRPVAALLPVDQLDLEPRHGPPHRPRAHVAVLHNCARAATLGEAEQSKDSLISLASHVGGM